MRALILAGVAALAAFPAAAEDGAALFAAQCKSCHAVTGKSGPAGPSLKGVAGRKVAALPDYAYSVGLKAKGGTWSDTALDAFLENPAGFAPGAKMFVKVSQAPKRAALIDYLKGLD